MRPRVIALTLPLLAFGAVYFLHTIPASVAVVIPRRVAPVATAPPLRVVAAPVRATDAPALPRVTAATYAVLDGRSGEALIAADADRVLPLASITKLATALVVLGMPLDWKDPVTITAADLREGSEPILIPGEAVTREELLAASLVGSSNVATVALARSTGLTPEAFAARMNAVGASLGLHVTRFSDPTGLDATNVSTAREAAYLARAAIGNTRIQQLLLTPQIELHPRERKSPKPRIIKSTDLLVSVAGGGVSEKFLGGKTGTLGPETGFHFAMAARRKPGEELVTVVLGSADAYARFDDARALTTWAFQTYHWN